MDLMAEESAYLYRSRPHGLGRDLAPKVTREHGGRTLVEFRRMFAEGSDSRAILKVLPFLEKQKIGSKERNRIIHLTETETARRPYIPHPHQDST